MIKNPYHILAKVLMGYYGLIQLTHLYVLARAASNYAQFSSPGFPASPPPAGWQDQTIHFLLVTGVVDAVNVGLVLFLVYAYFAQFWWWRPLGVVTLSISLYSAIIYTYGTVSSGAWPFHALEYWSVAAAFSPVGLLIILYITWGIKRQFWTWQRAPSA
ncbi:hypothetical protein EH223_19470 [candidate division KSB1 bacterium]|nr:hypothetical protein [candidate division KSB1 bacterium]RQW00126.1 MAG: hypothetical protein EH223_19470 [candidate division KSB1 bacterium]